MILRSTRIFLLPLHPPSTPAGPPIVQRLSPSLLVCGFFLCYVLLETCFPGSQPFLRPWQFPVVFRCPAVQNGL